MTTKYFALLTSQGAAKLANATALGTKLQIIEMALGDGGGTLPTPDASQTRLIGEKRRAPLNSLTVDAANSSQIIAEQIIPESEGGFWIREIGLFDADGVLIAVANCAETYKPQLQEGSGRTQTVRMILIVNSTTAVTLKIDPSVVLATRKYVDDAVIEVKDYADSLMAAHLKAADPHTQYAPKASPNFTGKPSAPTAALTANDKQLATTEFVQGIIGALSLGAASKRGVGTGLNQIPDMSSFTGLFEAAGYVTLPGGFICQWSGPVSCAQASSTVMSKKTWTFKTAFPNACLGVFPTMAKVNTYNPSANPVVSAGEPSLVAVELACGYSASTSTVNAFAIGF